MFFMATAFAADRNSLTTAPVQNSNEDTVIIQNCIVDDFFVTSDILDFTTEIPDEWDLYTVMHAAFNGNLLAGNVDFFIDMVDFFRIKRRMAGSLDWITIHEYTADSVSSLSISYLDMTTRSGTTYEYSIVPIIAGVESALYATSITTDFKGLQICDRDTSYNAQLNLDIQSSKNKPSSIVDTINRKYPYVIHNGAGNYYTGSITALFAYFSPDSCSWDFPGANKFRDQLYDFLYDARPKLIKYEDGRMWLCSISSPMITIDESEHPYNVNTTFEWAEIGNCDDEEDLRINGLIGNEVI